MGWVAGGLLVLVVGLAYANSFSGPFVFDDPTSVADNPTIRQLWPPGPLLSPPVTAGVGGRPLANISFALSWALSGEKVWGYHAGNLLVHALAALGLFGLARRTLRRPGLRERFGAAADGLALAIAGLWALHPVQTITVDYISQRTESLMGLFYLLTLYGLLRSAEVGASRWWGPLTVAACAMGMACKEVMVTAPVVALLYDRTFLAGSFAAAWRARWKIYLGLAATWGLLAILLIGVESRGVGFGAGVVWWRYAAGGCYAMATYLKLALWPHPLVFDYGPNAIDAISTWPYVLAMVGLGILVVLALWRRPRLGFLGAWFLLILLPTSSVVPIVRQMVAENRVYLPLVAIAVGVVLGAYTWIGRRALSVLAVIALACGAATYLRNDAYRTRVGLWSDTVAKRPDNWRARNILAIALGNEGRPEEGIAQARESLRIAPGLAETHNNLGTLLDQAGRPAEAAAAYETALKIEPWRADTHTNLGNALCKLHRYGEAMAQLEEALRLNPHRAEAHGTMANLLFMAGRTEEALLHYETAVRLAPASPEIHEGFGHSLLRLGRRDEAIAHLEKTLALRPLSATAHYNLGNALVSNGRLADAVAQYREALRLDPGAAEAANNLGAILIQAGQRTQARESLEAAVRAKPDYFDARVNLAAVLLDDGFPAEARVHYEAALQLQPDSTQAREGLAKAAEKVASAKSAVPR